MAILIDADQPYRPPERVTEPSRTTPEQQLFTDTDTGKIWDVTDPRNPVEVKYQYVQQARQGGHEVQLPEDTAQREFNQHTLKNDVFDREKGYDLSKYVRTGGSEKTLKDVGFTDKDIENARQFNKDTRGVDAPDYIDTGTYVKQYFKDKGWKYYDNRSDIQKESDWASKNREFDQHLTEAQKAHDDTFRPKVSMDTFVDNYFADKGWKQVNRAAATDDARREYDTRVKEASEAYIQKYGNLAALQSGVSSIGSFVFAPARALAPEVELKDISKSEWIIGGAQTALIAVPVVSRVIPGIAGKAVVKGLEAGAGAIFTKDTVDNWSNMNNTERAVSVAMDTFIIGSAVKGTVKPAATAAGKAGNYVKNMARSFGKDMSAEVDDVIQAIAKRDAPALQIAAGKLEIAAADVPPQLGGDVIKQKAQLMKAKPENYIKTETPKPSDPAIDELKKSIKTNEQFIDNAERVRKQVQSAPRRQAIDTQLQEAKRQVKEDKQRLQTAVKEKLNIPLVNYETFPEGKFLPSERTKVDTKALTKQKQASKTGNTPAVRTKTDTGVMPYSKTLEAQATRTQTKTATSTKLATATRTATATKTATKTETKPMPAVKPAPAVQTSTSTKVMPQPKPAVQPQPKPEISTKTVTETATETETKTSLAPYRPNKTATEQSQNERPASRSNDNGDDDDRRKSFNGAVAWKQGAVIFAVKSPYKSKDDVGVFSVKNPPAGLKMVRGGHKSAFRSIQTITGEAPSNLMIDMGIMDVKISRPTKEPGEQGAIKFLRDPGSRTAGDVTIKKHHTTRTRGQVVAITKSGERIVTRRSMKGKLLGRDNVMTRRGNRKIIRIKR